jgi:tripartite-type tricarboxylate transporter receptor subunit TctC
MTQRRAVLLAGIGGLVGAVPGLLRAQTFPSKPITLVTPFAAGGSPDALVRALAQELTADTGQTVIVDNKPGASSILAAQTVAKANPDGHTLLISGNVAFTANPHTFKQLPYDPVRDFEPIATLARGPMILFAHPGRVPSADAAGLVALARARPGEFSFGFTSATSRLPAELLQQVTGIRLNPIPYKAGVQALPDLIEGRIDLLFTDLGAMPHVKLGKLRALAVADAQRTPLAPEVPTLTEAGIRGVELPYWIAAHAPARTPLASVQRLHALFAKACRSAAVQRAMAVGGTTAFVTPLGALARFQSDEAVKWGAIIHAAGMQPE